MAPDAALDDEEEDELFAPFRKQLQEQVRRPASHHFSGTVAGLQAGRRQRHGVQP